MHRNITLALHTSIEFSHRMLKKNITIKKMGKKIAWISPIRSYLN